MNTTTRALLKKLIDKTKNEMGTAIWLATNIADEYVMNLNSGPIFIKYDGTYFTEDGGYELYSIKVFNDKRELLVKYDTHTDKDLERVELEALEILYSSARDSFKIFDNDLASKLLKKHMEEL